MIKYKARYFARLQKEYNIDLDPRCRAVLLELAWWAEKRFRKDIILTCIGRTEEENNAIKASKFSAHLIKEDKWIRGFDIRSRNFTEEERIKIVDYLEKIWNNNEKFLHIVNSSHGTGPHIHINIRYQYRIPKF